MNIFLWTMALSCWSTAAVLVACMIYPDWFQRLHGRGAEETSR
jgi:hypothetical protein